jgi:hypothetical protein
MWHDLHYGARLLWRPPGFTLIAVLTLGYGIGASITVFSKEKRNLMSFNVRDHVESEGLFLKSSSSGVRLHR